MNTLEAPPRPAWAKKPGDEGEEIAFLGIRLMPWIGWDGFATIDFERLSGDDLGADDARRLAHALLGAADEIDAINGGVLT